MLQNYYAACTLIFISNSPVIFNGLFSPYRPVVCRSPSNHTVKNNRHVRGMVCIKQKKAITHEAFHVGLNEQAEQSNKSYINWEPIDCSVSLVLYIGNRSLSD